MAGDYADEIIDSMIDRWGEYDEDLEDDGDGGFVRRAARTDLVCDNCGAKGLRWLEVAYEEYVLSADGLTRHSCVDLDAFEVIE